MQDLSAQVVVLDGEDLMVWVKSASDISMMSTCDGANLVSPTLDGVLGSVV